MEIKNCLKKYFGSYEPVPKRKSQKNIHHEDAMRAAKYYTMDENK